MSEHKTFWKIKEAGVNLKSTFLFDASGRNSRLPKQMGLKCVSSDKQIAICGFFEGIGINELFSFTEAVANGWWYTAQLRMEKWCAHYLQYQPLYNVVKNRSTH